MINWAIMPLLTADVLVTDGPAPGIMDAGHNTPGSLVHSQRSAMVPGLLPGRPR